MEQLLEIAARYGTTAVVAVILFISVSRWLGKQTITFSVGKPGNNGNGSNGGNGNGKLSKAEVAELIGLHHLSCSTELYKHIDEFNRALGRIEGHLEAKK